MTANAALLLKYMRYGLYLMGKGEEKAEDAVEEDIAGLNYTRNVHASKVWSKSSSLYVELFTMNVEKFR